MTFEWIGVATIIAGIFCLSSGRAMALPLFLFSNLFGAAAASILTALGGANLPPSHLLLGFLTIMAVRQPYLNVARKAFSVFRPGFWLAITLAYGLTVTIFMPRIMAGGTDVFSISRSDSGAATLTLVAFGPVSGNFTQSIYFVGDVACFAILYALTADRAGKLWFADGMIACGWGNLLFAALDYLTFFTQSADYLSVIRNAPYRIFDTAEVVGLKRLIGSFPEASAFSAMTLTLFAFVATLWLNGYRSRQTGVLSLLLAVALVLSTSATAYVSFGLYISLLYLTSLRTALRGRATRMRQRALLFMPIVLFITMSAISLSDNLAGNIYDLFDQLVLQKGTTDSAIERGSWNLQALVNFADSAGVGLGIGSVRASSFVTAALANIGAIGALTYAIFIFQTLVPAQKDRPDSAEMVRSAGANACAALLISGCLAATSIDLGLIFFACAGLAASPALDALTPVGQPRERPHASSAILVGET